MEPEDYGQNRLVSSSHLTVSQNIELRNLLNDCNRMSCLGNLAGWRWKLDAIQRELNYDMLRLDGDKRNDEDTKTYAKQLEENKNKIRSLKKTDKAALYTLLSERETILRHIQEKAGKGTKRTFEDDDDDD